MGNTKCYLDKTGKALTGVRIINEKFYWLGKNARRDAKKTRQLQAAAVYEKDFSALKKLIEIPSSPNTWAAATKPGKTAEAAPQERVEVSRQAYDDCDGSGHGYFEITYSDGTVEIQEY